MLGETLEEVDDSHLLSLALWQDVQPNPATVRRRLDAVGEYRFSNISRLLYDVSVKDMYSTPLFQGMGTHYSFLYVGTPPQR
jgi:hypothetical protein